MKNFVGLIRTPFTTLLQTDYSSFTAKNKFSNVSSYMQTGFKKAKKLFKNSPYMPFIIVILLVVVVAVFAIRGVLASSQGPLASQGDNRVAVSKPVAQQTLNKEFTFPLKDSNGKEVSKLVYEIQSAELRNEIVVKGQLATAIKGRAFLVINIKITNNYDKAISINARDYLRLIIDGSSEKLAPDIHNDPVEVQAISTKPTRVGIAVNDNEKNIVLQVGEIDGKKELIKLNLK